MANKERDSGRGEGSGLDMLRDELTDFLGAQVEHLVDKAGDKLGDVTDQLHDVAENGGTLAGVGGRILQGDSPLKAFVGEKANGLKDRVVGKVKSVFGGERGGKSGSTKVMNIIECWTWVCRSEWRTTTGPSMRSSAISPKAYGVCPGTTRPPVTGR
jgi:hypothetical protein